MHLQTFHLGRQSGGVHRPPSVTLGFSFCTRSIVIWELNSINKRPTEEKKRDRESEEKSISGMSWVTD